MTGETEGSFHCKLNGGGYSFSPLIYTLQELCYVGLLKSRQAVIARTVIIIVVHDDL